MPDIMRRKAEASMVHMDTILTEAFFAFYWLSKSRQCAIGMGGAIEFMIPLSEISTYHSVFKPRMDLDHFIRVIRSADSEYIIIKSENMKKLQDAKPKK